MSAPILAINNPKRDTELHTDTSSYEFGAALMQKQDDERFHPVTQFTIRKLPQLPNLSTTASSWTNTDTKQMPSRLLFDVVMRGSCRRADLIKEINNETYECDTDLELDEDFLGFGPEDIDSVSKEEE